MSNYFHRPKTKNLLFSWEKKSLRATLLIKKMENNILHRKIKIGQGGMFLS